MKEGRDFEPETSHHEDITTHFQQLQPTGISTDSTEPTSLFLDRASRCGCRSLPLGGFSPSLDEFPLGLVRTQGRRDFRDEHFGAIPRRGSREGP